MVANTVTLTQIDPLVGMAANLMTAHLDTADEILPNLESQAFATWLHGVYLAAMYHMDSDNVIIDLLYNRIRKMINTSQTLLTASNISTVSTTAKLVFDNFSALSIDAKLNSRDLFTLATRLQLGPKTNQLLAWVDLAFGDNPRNYTNLTYFGVNADGSLTQTGLPSGINTDITLLVSTQWKTLPAFWRLLYVVSKAIPPNPNMIVTLLETVVAVSALPRAVIYNTPVLFTNYIALLRNMTFLFSSIANNDLRNTSLIYRLLQPWNGLAIKGRLQAESWLAWLNTDRTLFNQSLYKVAINRLIENKLDPVIFASLEAVTTKPAPDTSNDATTDDNTDTKDNNSDTTDTDTDTDATATDSTTDNTDSDPDTTTTDDATTDPTDPTADNGGIQSIHNNSIGEISLAQDVDPGEAYLYKRAVIALNDTLLRDPNIAINQNIRQTLHLWCRDWLWLANVTQTQLLIKDLGLQKVLEPVEHKD